MPDDNETKFMASIVLTRAQAAGVRCVAAHFEMEMQAFLDECLKSGIHHAQEVMDRYVRDAAIPPEEKKKGLRDPAQRPPAQGPYEQRMADILDDDIPF